MCIDGHICSIGRPKSGHGHRVVGRFGHELAQNGQFAAEKRLRRRVGRCHHEHIATNGRSCAHTVGHCAARGERILDYHAEIFRKEEDKGAHHRLERGKTAHIRIPKRRFFA